MAGSTTRDALRAKVLGNAPKLGSIIVPFNGEQIELRQQTLRVAMASYENEKQVSAAERAARLVVDYAYIPGTNERVFEVADIPVLLEMPFGPEWVEIQRSISKLMGVTEEDVARVEEQLNKSPLDA
jgi:hypothetical protein